MPKPAVALLLTALLAPSLLVACSEEPLSRTGGTADPETLSAVWGQGPTGIGGDVLAQLIEGTDSAAVRVTSSGPPRAAEPSEERHAVEALIAGDGEITVVRAGILQLLGAYSLAPLGVPFVVTNNDQAAAIAADADLSRQLMSGLDQLGLVGLGLVPAGLRHPFAYGTEPLLSAGDYADQVINVREDAGVQAILDHLGARADHSVNTERHELARHDLRGIEVSVQQVGAVDLPAVQTVNVALYEKFDVAVIRKETWDGLSEPQQQDLHDSFLQAAKDAMDSRVTEEQGQASWCALAGAGSVLASRSELGSLHDALDPIAERAAEGPGAASVLDRMRELGNGTIDPTPTGCTGQPRASAAEYHVIPKGSQSVLDGLWRLEVDAQALLDAGANPQDAYDNAGVWEFRIEDGYADGVQPNGQRCNGQFAFDGDQVSLDLGVRGVEDCYGIMRGEYRLDGDRVFFDWQKEQEYALFLDQVMFAPGMVKIE